MKFLLRFPNLWFMILLIETAARFSCITSYVFSDMDECTSNYHAVTTMPFARTQRVRTPAVVRQDIQGMGRFVVVSDLVFF